MAVLLIVNRASGTGRAARLADRLSHALGAAGIGFARCDARDPTPAGQPRARYLRRFDAAVLVGGDGTMHHLLADLCDAGVPVYHAPAGTENLFAREFGMDGEPQTLIRALHRGLAREVDTAEIGGRPMALMASLGPDAGVIARLDAVRSRAAGHAMYARPVFGELLRPRIAHLSVRVDGREVVSEGRGMLVIANCRQYARRLNPAPDADMTDGLLDAVFLPARSTARMLLWAALCASGEHVHHDGVVLTRGREVEVTAHAQTPIQCDGEAVGWLEPGERLRVAISSRVLLVLSA